MKGSETKMPLVSVVIPAYQVEGYMAQCIGSVAEQTYRNLEIIIVYDACSDRTLDLCRYWQSKDNRIKIIEHTERRGLGAARNAGVKNAQGEFVCFLDADDWYEPDFVEGLVEAMEGSRAELASYAGRYNIVDGVKKAFYYLIPGEYIPVSDRQIFMLRDIHPVWNRMYLKSWLLEQDIWEPELYHYEDWGFQPVVELSASRIVVAEGTRLNYRVSREGSLSGERLITYMDDWKRAFDYIVDHLSLRGILQENRQCLYYYYRGNRAYNLSTAKKTEDAEAIRAIGEMDTYVKEKLGICQKDVFTHILVWGSENVRRCAERVLMTDGRPEYLGSRGLVGTMDVLDKIRSVDKKTLLILDFMEEQKAVSHAGAEKFLKDWKQQCEVLIRLLKDKKDIIKTVLVSNRLSLEYGSMWQKETYGNVNLLTQMNGQIAALEAYFRGTCEESQVPILTITPSASHCFTDGAMGERMSPEHANSFLYAGVGLSVFTAVLETDWV